MKKIAVAMEIACLMAAAGAARGQCIWSHHDSIQGAGGIAIYHEELQKVLFVSSDSYTPNTII